jgi:amidase
MSETSKWEEIAQKRKQKQLDSIPKEWLIELPPEECTNVMDVPRTCGLLSTRELEITEVSDVNHTLAKLASREWSAVEVTTAFSKRAIIAQQLTNCLTEIFVDRALVRAAELDEHLQKTGKTVGPLHGLPISLKDQFSIKGLETIMGYVSWVGAVAEKDCVLVEILYELGAVPFVRTNVPQTLMWGETYNLVFGRTTNPYNRNLTPGGSSGGEGALLALKGSPLGIGTDIGGSVRIPATFCGLYSLRPSYERFPYQGTANSMEGQESVSSVLGPMCNSVSGLKTFSKAIIDAQPWRKDPLALRIPWNEDAYNLNDHGNGTGLCFAFIWDDGVVKPHPPLYRAMLRAKRALIAAGHKVIDWENLKHLEILQNLSHIYCADAGEDFTRACAPTGEPLLKSMATYDPHNPKPLPPPVDQPLEKALVTNMTTISAYELWQLHKERRALRKEYLDHWEKTIERTGTGRPVDAIICPAAPYAAPIHAHNINAFYTAIWNSLDFTASVFPATTVDPSLDKPVPPHEFYNSEDKFIYEMYDPKDYKDAPVGLQLVGRSQEEEAVIAMTEIVDHALKQFNDEIVITETELKLSGVSI